jgi:hypothetical protein
MVKKATVKKAAKKTTSAETLKRKLAEAKEELEEKAILLAKADEIIAYQSTKIQKLEKKIKKLKRR